MLKSVRLEDQERDANGTCYDGWCVPYSRTSRVPAVLLQGHSTNVHISISIFCPKAYHRPDHLLRILEKHKKKLLSLNPTIFVFTAHYTSFRFKDFLLYN
jgi:hypothetical protein